MGKSKLSGVEVKARRQSKRQPEGRKKVSKRPSNLVPRIKSDRLESRLNGGRCDDGDRMRVEDGGDGDVVRGGCRNRNFGEFKKVVRESNVILEVLDSRDPLGTRSMDVERRIMMQDPRKKIVLVLSKVDLIPGEVLNEWLKILRVEYPTIAFANVGRGRHLGRGKKGCMGAADLISLLKNYSRQADRKVQITVGVIGIPNVGKSSIINSLKGSNTVGVAPVPGSTKMMQEVVLDANIRLLDCPGVIYSMANSEAEAVLRNSIRIEDVVDLISPMKIILGRTGVEQIMGIYGVPCFVEVEQFLCLFAEKYKMYRSGGLLDLGAAARRVLRDWNTGKIPHISLPPKRHSSVIMTSVREYAEEFNVGDAMSVDEASTYKSVEEKMSVCNEGENGEFPSLNHLKGVIGDFDEFNI